jgi:1,4-alpha-glucan branching enzyme
MYIAVIIQMFEWNWNSIGQECADFIGPAGYTHVQVSTATEHIQGDQWWTSYQVVSHNIQSRRGSRDEFAAMVTKCNNAGVQVLVDTVFNHMAGIDGGSGVAGSSFSHYQYGSLFSGDDFHYCGTSGNDICASGALCFTSNYGPTDGDC